MGSCSDGENGDEKFLLVGRAGGKASGGRKKKREASGGREEWRETSGGRKYGGRWILGRGGCSSVRVEERRRNGSWMSRSRRRHVGLEDGAVGRV